jgi:small subunit ribosomal protein S20
LAEAPKKKVDDKKKPEEKKKRKQTAAEKQIRQSAKRRLRNRAVLTRLKHVTRDFRALTSRKEAEAALPGLYSAMDKARKQGILHAKAASRHKSRLALSAKKLT